MNLQEAKAAIEALLFTMGRSVSVEELAGVLEIDKDTVVKIVHCMMDEYAVRNRGIRIIELDDAFQMCTKPEMYDYIIRLTHQPKKHVLTDVMLETLSIIAYKQPITRGEIEELRGVNTSYILNALQEKGLITEAGRKEALGRPILYATSEEFLRHFGLSSTKDLPVLPEE